MAEIGGGRMTAAEVLEPVMRAALGGGDLAIHLRCWDGSELGPADAPLQLAIVRRRGLRRLLWAPNELGVARAYVSGDIQVEGDVLAGLSYLEKLGTPGVRIDAGLKRDLVRAALRLRVLGPPPRPPAEEV